MVSLSNHSDRSNPLSLFLTFNYQLSHLVFNFTFLPHFAT